MDATGASTSTGRSAGPADVTESAEDATTGPSRPVGRADATGPLPVQAPADPTGPLPAPEAGSWFTSATDDTATGDTVAQPVVAPPSWFATGPLPAVPATPENPAPPDAATPPAGATATPVATDAPADLFEPVAATGPNPATSPPTEAIPVVGPPPPPGPDPAGAAPPPSGAAPPPQGVPAEPPPPTAAIPVVGPPDPAGAAPPPSGTLPPPQAIPTEPPPPTAAIPVVGGPPPMGQVYAEPPAPGGLFAPATPPAVTGAPPGSGAPVDLFAPATPPLQPTAPSAPQPPTGLFPAVAPPPTAPAATVAPPVAAAPAAPVEPVWPADATGPMPVVNPAGAPPSAEAVGGGPPTPAPEAPPSTGAWSFDPAPPRPARTDSRPTPSDDRRRGAVQSWPLPKPAGGGHSPSLTMVASPNTATKQSKRRAWPLTVVGVLVAVAAGIALVFSVARANPADLAVSAATDAGGWPGAHYQGAVAANDGGEIDFDLTVTPDGASGTLTREGGKASAELLWDQGGALIRANKEWWLYHHPTRADDLAGAWVAEPLTETQEIDPVLRLTGTALADYVRGEQPSQWQALEQQLVEGRSGVVLFDGARRVVVGSEDAHPLLALDVAPNANTPPVPVSRPTDEQLAAVTGAAARVRQESAPKTLAQLLQERPNVAIQLQPDPLCTAQTCNVTVTVTNSGTAPARGRLEVSADGKVVATHPLDVPPGQVATFTAGAPNPQFAQPGATGRILWETRAVDD